MINILRNNVEEVLIFAIILLVIIVLVNLLIAFTKMCEKIDRLYVGAIDVLGGMALMTIWNHAFRDTEYVSPVIFWVVAIGYLLIMIIGMIMVCVSIMSSDARKK